MPRKRAIPAFTALSCCKETAPEAVLLGHAARCSSALKNAGFSRHTRRAVPQRRCFDDGRPLLAAAATAAAIGAAP